MTHPPTSTNAGGAVWLFIAAALLSAAAFVGYRQHLFYSRATRVEGVVVRLAESVSRSGRTRSPVVRFRSTSGEHEVTGRVGTTPSLYSVGDRVRVAYPASDPSAARLDDLLNRWGLVVGLSLLGAGFGYLGVGKKKISR